MFCAHQTRQRDCDVTAILPPEGKIHDEDQLEESGSAISSTIARRLQQLEVRS